MKINWKLRLKNKTTLITLVTLTITLIYQILGALDIVPKVSQDSATQIVMMVVNLLSAVGVVVDPTTQGISDSETAMYYEEPRQEVE